MSNRVAAESVLIVDDDANMCRSLSRILKADGYQVEIAQSASQALERDDWSDFFAILLDRKLPDDSGDSLLKSVVERAPEAVIIIITGYADLNSSLEAIRAGAADYLLKPVDPDHLRLRLKHFADLKKARDASRTRDEQVRFMVENLPAGAVYVDIRTGRIRINRHLEQLTGYSAEELPDRETWIQKLLGPQGEECLKDDLNTSNLQNPQPHKVEVWPKHGPSLLMELTGYRYDDHEVWLVTDITERERYEEQLRTQRDFSEQILETAQVIILVLDTESRIVRYNRFMEELTGYALTEVIHKNWFDTFIPQADSTQIQLLFNRVLAGEEVHGHINSIKTKSGKLKEIAWWGRVLKNKAGEATAVLSIGHDVTAFRDIQSKLLQAERLAAIGEMIAGLAHESRNALQRARACVDVLSLDLEENSSQTELTSRIASALTELQRLYEEVRNYAAPVQLSLGNYSLREIWQNAWGHLADSHLSKSVELKEIDICAETSCIVDRLKIEQVFRNVLENAIAASPENSTIEIRVSPTTLNSQSALLISIKDFGEGLHTEQPEQIFEPFYTTKQKGTGLGMAITKRIIDAHHGTIRVVSEPQQGVTMEFVLPCSP